MIVSINLNQSMTDFLIFNEEPTTVPDCSRGLQQVQENQEKIINPHPGNEIRLRLSRPNNNPIFMENSIICNS